MMISGSSSFLSINKYSLPVLDLSTALLIRDADALEFWGVSQVGSIKSGYIGDSVCFSKDGNIYTYEGFKEKKQSLPMGMQAMKIACITGDLIGLKESKSFACCNAEGELLYSLDLSKRISYVYFVSPDLAIINSRERVLAINKLGVMEWEKTFQIDKGTGFIQKALPVPEYSKLFIHYGESPSEGNDAGHTKLLVVDVLSGDTLLNYDINNRIYKDGFFVDEDVLWMVDDAAVWKLSAATGENISYKKLDGLNGGNSLTFTESTLVVSHEHGPLYIYDKTTLNHLHTLDLGQGQYNCHMAGNKTGVAVRLVDKNAFKGGGAGYGLYLTDEQLVKGEMPDLTPEPLAASVEKTPTEGGYNLTVTLNAELTVADFLRHLSHALWQTAYEHCTLVDAIDSTNVRLGPPDFMGTLTLNLKNAPELTGEQEQAINAIIEGAKRTMCGLGECIAQANTDDQRVVEIVVE